MLQIKRVQVPVADPKFEVGVVSIYGGNEVGHTPWFYFPGFLRYGYSTKKGKDLHGTPQALAYKSNLKFVYLPAIRDAVRTGGCDHFAPERPSVFVGALS